MLGNVVLVLTLLSSHFAPTLTGLLHWPETRGGGGGGKDTYFVVCVTRVQSVEPVSKSQVPILWQGLFFVHLTLAHLLMPLHIPLASHTSRTAWTNISW